MPATSATPLIAPPLLGVGARIALVSPSGPLRDVADLARAEGHARVFGWETVVGPSAMARDGYFAGADSRRLADLRAAIEDPTIDGIWCLRGGYGSARLLPGLDLQQIARARKALIGYSDITALHAAWKLAGVQSYHGPVARAHLTPFARESFMRAVIRGDDSAGVAADAQVLRAGVATGRLAGGNLALLASLCGTPWAVDFRDAIVVLEDINEATYRVDRMLNQLLQSGALRGCAGLAFGHCTSCTEEAGDDGSRSLAAIVTECANVLGVPAMLGIPVGHIDDQWTLPLGAMATLDTEAGSLVVHRAPVA